MKCFIDCWVSHFGSQEVYDRHSYDMEKQEALNAWGARMGIIMSNLELVKLQNNQV
jgi:hypothetical protein